MTYDLTKHFRMLATYNTLANERLYETCATLTDTELRKKRPAFFKSIHGTLNHIMVGDRIWLARFAGEEVPSIGLDAILYDSFEQLHAARIFEDARIEDFVTTIDAEFLESTIEYTNNEGRVFVDPVPLLLSHFFNHQTHHRGQIHDMLTQTEVAPPALDMHRVIHPNPS
jgi:uncharacterized damage-inducible protein DinB